MEINTVIFDLDGTLLNTLDDLYLAFNYAIKSFGYPERSKEEIKSFVGNGIKKAIERALPEKVSEEELNYIINVFKDYYQKNMYKNTKVYDGILQMLAELKNRGYKLAVVSNKYDAAVKKLCGEYFDNYIDCAVGEVKGTDRKPNPIGIYKVMEELKVNKEQAVYVGDSDVDIKTAQNADIPCISVLWGFKEKDFLMQNGARVFAENPNDIVKTIEKKLYLV